MSRSFISDKYLWCNPDYSHSMLVLSDNDVQTVIEDVLRAGGLKDLQQSLAGALQDFYQDPSLIPARTVQTSKTPSSDATHLFMPCVGVGEAGLKVITGGATNSKLGKGFVGGVLVLDPYDGSLRAVVNGRTLTAFRTALASSLAMAATVRPNEPYSEGSKAPEGQLLPELSVLGSGLQAYWHARLCLMLYGKRITKVNLINRSRENAQKLQSQLQKAYPDKQFTTIVYGDEQEKLKTALTNSSFILGCLPSTEAVIKEEHINPDPKYVKFINLIGSYKPHMIELDKEYIQKEFQDAKIIVDSKEHALHEAGELIQSNKTEADVVEIAELASNELSIRTGSNVILCKIVGLACMDIRVANFLVDYGTKTGTNGTNVDF